MKPDPNKNLAGLYQKSEWEQGIYEEVEMETTEEPEQVSVPSKNN